MDTPQGSSMALRPRGDTGRGKYNGWVPTEANAHVLAATEEEAVPDEDHGNVDRGPARMPGVRV